MRNALMHKKGFSLIETALAMAIAGVMIASMLASYQVYASKKAPNETRSRKETVRIALERYLTTYNKLPCPADPALSTDHPLAGIAISPCPPVGLAVGACAGGICRTEAFEPALSSMQSIIIGGLPYVTLGISYKEAFDGWQGSLGYAVSHRQTVAYTNNHGNIDLKMYNPILVEPSLLKNNLPANIDLVVWSAGKNGAGAYNGDGKMRTPCVAGSKEEENCNVNPIFKNFDKQRSFIAGSADYYDDYILIDDISVKTDRWAQTSANIFNSSNGRIGIGTSTPFDRLDVAGNVMSDKTSGNYYCDENGSNCFPAKIIGSTGVNCGTGVLTGIKNATASCFNKVDTSSIVPGNCPMGQYVVAIDGLGRIACCSPGTKFVGYNPLGFGKCCPASTVLSGYDGTGEPICM